MPTLLRALGRQGALVRTCEHATAETAPARCPFREAMFDPEAGPLHREEHERQCRCCDRCQGDCASGALDNEGLRLEPDPDPVELEDR